MKVGILGGGQLARMLSLAAYPLGITTVCYDPSPQACANQVTQLIVAKYDDTEALQKFAAEVNCITYETENIPHLCLELLGKQTSIFPPITALELSQDRLFEKELFNELNIPTTQYKNIDSWEALVAGIEQLGLPAVLKTRRLGYDGKGQYYLKQQDDLQKAWQLHQNIPSLLEEFISFEKEVSQIAVRNQQGDINFYPLTLNIHKQGILRISQAPFYNEKLEQQAQLYTAKIMEKFNYVGVLAVEFFVANEQLIANEIAPRVHNTGHWTIEGAQTSQFENHIRAICNLPLGSTPARGECAMFNLIGKEIPKKEILAVAGAHLHDYGKSVVPLRKLGHVTLTNENNAGDRENFQQLKDLTDN